MPSQPTRDQVPADLTWDLTPVYSSREDWAADLAAVEAALPRLVAFRGRLGDGAATFLAFLRERDAAHERLERALAYAELNAFADGTSAENQAMSSRALALLTRVGVDLSFFPSEVLALPSGAIDEYLAAEPSLEPYRPQLAAILRRAPHLLSPDAERALAAVDGALRLPRATWDRATAADLVCEPVDDGRGGTTPVSIARWQFGIDQSADRGLRRRAYESLNRGLAAHKHTLAGTLVSQIENNVAVARLRGYGSAIEMILAPGQVPESAYRTILREVHDGIAPHARRLAKLRQRVLGIDAMRLSDLMAPLDPEFDPPLSFADAERLIRAGLAPLGDEYGSLVESAFRDRWIDRADNVGKRSGAWGFSVYGAHPYVFLTWRDGWRSALTLAHELGHACHAALSCGSQIVGNAPTESGLAFTGVPDSPFFGEGPSTANEVLVGQHIIETTTDPRLRRFVIEQFLQTFTHNFVTHLLEAHFERRLYDRAEAGQPITTADVLDAQSETFERFWGDALTLDEHARLYWAQQVHFYLNYYSYNYSAGLTVGLGVADAIRREGQPAVDRWLAALRAGSTRPPLELARLAGIDLTRPEVYRNAVAYFGRLVDELERSYGSTDSPRADGAD